MSRSYKTTGTELLSTAGRLIAHDLVSRRCPVCGRRMYLGGSKVDELQIDHLVAHAQGGADELGNLIPMCGSCNASKSDKNLIDWLPSRLVAVGACKAKTAAWQLKAAVTCATRLELLASTIKTACNTAGITE